MTRHPWRVLSSLAVVSVAAAALASAAVFVPVADAQSVPAAGAGLTGIRIGRHATYDRVVLDFRGPAPTSFRATWVPTLVADPSGKRITLPGNAFLSVVVRSTSTADVNGRRTYFGPRTISTPQAANVRAVAITGDVERVLTVGMGARHRAWVHVFRLSSPSRVVVDVGR